MANIKPVYATEATAQTIAASLAAGSADSGSEIDNSTNRYIDIRLDVELSASGAETGVVSVYVSEGSATGKTATTANVMNMCWAGDIQMNGTTTVRASFLVERISKFWRTHVINNGAVALAASGNTVKYTGINYENI